MRSVVGRTKRRMRIRSGQGLVEFVLIAPLLLLLIFGLVEFARAWNIRHVVTDAAREGARNLAVRNSALTTDSVTTIIKSALAASGMDPDSATIALVLDETNPSLVTGEGSQGNPARVTITYPYNLGIVKAFLGWTGANGRLDITSTFVMRNE